MNENIDLTKILKDCPDGWEFFTPICGEVKFCNTSEFLPIAVTDERGLILNFSKEGFYNDHGSYLSVECLLFPSKDQRDWSKFSAPWFRKRRFDYRTLKHFDKVLARNNEDYEWVCGLFAGITGRKNFPYSVYCKDCKDYKYCIPCDEYTESLIGTTHEAPEYYRYWDEYDYDPINIVKESRFDPKNLNPFDKVLVRNYDSKWVCGLYSHTTSDPKRPFNVGSVGYKYCVPYNEATKHLAGTYEKAPEYYRYWED